jgi:ATP-binding cassette subfamily F protein uup
MLREKKIKGKKKSGKWMIPASELPTGGGASAPAKPKKLSYKDQRDLELLPQRIEQLEAELATVQERLADPALYQSAGEEVDRLNTEMKRLETDLATAYDRWEALEA